MKLFALRLFPLAVLGFVMMIEVQAAFSSTIMGVVYDDHRNRLADVDLELLDDLSRPLNRAKTDGSGRYQFSGLRDGRFVVRALPFKYDLATDEQSVEITTVSVVSAEGSTTIIQDFYLRPKRSSIAGLDSSVVFAQEIPKDAKVAYEKAMHALGNARPDEGLAGLKQAITIFPDYFLALEAIGREHFLKGKFADAVPFLVRSADINNKSPISFFLLGYSLHKLGYNRSAIVALTQAATLNPASPSIFLALGTAERLEGLFVDAEKHLVQAKKLTKSSLPDVHWQLAMLFGENLKRYNEAATEFEQFLKERPNAQDAEKIRKIIKTYRERAKD